MSVRVLIVDDQPPFRNAARAVVEAADGFEVVGEAETGEAAVKQARRLNPDLVLMDVNLPGIDGFEATRQIRENAGSRTAVLLLSTYDEADYAGMALESGAQTFIPKSKFDPVRLMEAWRARSRESGSTP